MNSLEKIDGTETKPLNETEPTLSKGQKKRAKKQQKKYSESSEGNNGKIENESKPVDTPLTVDVASDKPTTETVENDGVPTLKTVSNTSSTDSEEARDQFEEMAISRRPEPIVPIIKRFDVNGKQLRTMPGKAHVFLGEITPHNIMQLKKLNEAVFPIAYNDKFYVEARVCGDLGRLAYYNDAVVGAVCCRIDDISDEKALYLMTLGTLAAYRQCGIGTILINYALKLCKKMKEIKTMYLHVQVNNQKAVQFYEKHGFINDGIIEDYYRINPRDAYLLIKRIR